jgi:uncharacterized protein (TIGR00661 family)
LSHFSNFPQNISQNAKILVAPLDWGLGHATRCIALMQWLVKEHNAQITVAATGAQRAIISEAFPEIAFLSPPQYHIKYHKNRAATVARLVFSLPRILKTIRAEAVWLQQVLETRSFDAIISDNRYGLSHSTIPSYLLTHQLLVKTPFGTAVNLRLQRKLYKLVNRFTECWVPDYEKEPFLAADLSHPAILPAIPVRYLGPLSRLTQLPADGFTQLLVILSGPEPQRSILEKLVLKQWTLRPGRSMVLVRGLPAATASLPAPPNAIVFNHLAAGPLSQQVANAGAVLCRSGYSSIMDLLPLQANCYMVPTPGQTEQEYLADFLNAAGRITMVHQHQLQISTLLEAIDRSSPKKN